MTTARELRLLPEARKRKAEVGELLDVRGVALYCSGGVEIDGESLVSESAVRHWIERGHLPALKVGGRIFVRRASLERFLEQREREFARARGSGA